MSSDFVLDMAKEHVKTAHGCDRAPAGKGRLSTPSDETTSCLDQEAEDRRDDEEDEEEDTSEWEETDDVSGGRRVPRGCCGHRLSSFTKFVLQLSFTGVLLAPALVMWLAVENPSQDAALKYFFKGVRHWFTFLAASWFCAVVLIHLVGASSHLVLFFGKLFFGGVSERNKSRLEFFLNLQPYLAYLLVSIFSTLCFALVFDRRDLDGNTDQIFIYRSLLVSIVFFLCLLAEKTAIQAIAVRFHKSAYEERILDNKFAIWVLDRLRQSLIKKESLFPNLRANLNSKSIPVPSPSRASWWPWKSRTKVTAATPQTQLAESDSPPKTFNPNLFRSRTAAKRSSLRRCKTVRIPSKPESSAGESAVENAPAPSTTFTSNDSVLSSKKFFKGTQDIRINSHRQARDLAKQLYFQLLEDRISRQNDVLPSQNSPRRGTGVSPHPSQHYWANRAKANEEIEAARVKNWEGHKLSCREFVPYFDSVEEAQDAFALFDKDQNGDVDRREFTNGILNVYKERSTLLKNLRDVSQAVRRLESLFFVVALLITVMAAVLIYGATSSFTGLVPMATLLAAWSFVFGNSARELFSGIIFLFVQHCFDIGDRVFIDDVELVVYRIHLLTTVFRKWDGTEIYVSNAILSTKFIHNIRRSPNQLENIVSYVAVDTPKSKISELRKRLAEYVRVESREFTASLDVNVDLCLLQNIPRMKLIITIEHRDNWFIMNNRWDRRTLFVLEVTRVLQSLDISYNFAGDKNYVAEDKTSEPGFRAPPQSESWNELAAFATVMPAAQ